jgi:hypothetical protein
LAVSWFKEVMIRDEKIIRDKLKFYKENDVSVHLVLYSPLISIPKPFRNGKVLEIRDNCIIFVDEKLGKIMIGIDEIISVEKREVKR